MHYTFTCAHCGAIHPVAVRTVFDSQALCPDCLSEHTTTCTRCGTRIWTEDNAGTEDEALCQRCYGNHHTSCNRCGTLLRWDDRVSGLQNYNFRKIIAGLTRLAPLIL